MYNPLDTLTWKAEKQIETLCTNYTADEKMAFFPLLAGIPPYNIEYAHQGHLYGLAIDECHKYYVEHNDCEMKKRLEGGIESMIKMSTKLTNLDSMFNVIFYEMKIEKNGKAAFKLDWDNILKLVNEKMEELNPKLSVEDDCYNDWHNNVIEYAQNKFGVTIL